MLAVMATAAGQKVSIEQLTTAVWDGAQPLDTRRTVQLYIARLRAELGAEVIETSPTAYTLCVSPEQVDALRFVRLLDDAAASASVTEERGMLAEALDLWRGRPFEDVRSRWLETARAPQLLERYLSALERRIEIDIAAGLARELVAELAELTQRYPLRESLWLRRLVVLERSGRQAEALAQYEVIRVLLAEELGADPGAELRRVHADLLAARPPAEEWRAEIESRRPLPQQLPLNTPGFIGRQDELRWLEESLAEGRVRRSVAICSIVGAAGIGKSALALQMAHRQAHHYADGQLYVDLQGSTAGVNAIAPIEVLSRFLRALGVDPQAIPVDLDEAGAEFRSVSADKQLLVVLDNAADAAQVRPLLPSGVACAVLITSRTVLSRIDGARHRRLDVLEVSEAAGLLAQMVGKDRIAAEPDATADVIRYCGSLPLAVRIVGARLAARPAWPIDAMAQRLADAQRRLDELEISDAGARTSFAVSAEQARNSSDPLDRSAAEAFESLGAVDITDLSAPVVASLLDCSDAMADRLLERLVDIQLIEAPAPRRYRLHSLLRLYSRELADEQLRMAALARVLGFYLATVRRTLQLLRPGDYRLTRVDSQWHTGGLDFDDDQAALSWLESERANLAAIVRQAVASRSTVAGQQAVQLVHVLFGFFEVRGHWADWAELNELTFEVADLLGQAQIHNDLGVRGWRLAQYEQALDHLRQSLVIRRELGDSPGQVASLVNLGLVYQWQGQYDDARNSQEEAVKISRAIGDPRGEAGGLTNLGNVYQRQGRHEDALSCFRESSAIYRRMRDRKGEAITFNNVGALYERQGRFDDALTSQLEGLAIYREIGDRDGEAYCLSDIGTVHRRQGRTAEALEVLHESLVIRQQTGDSHGQAEVLRELGMTARQLGQTEQARVQLQQALSIFEGLRTTEASRLRGLLSELEAGSTTV